MFCFVFDVFVFVLKFEMRSEWGFMVSLCGWGWVCLILDCDIYCSDSFEF